MQLEYEDFTEKTIEPRLNQPYGSPELIDQTVSADDVRDGIRVEVDDEMAFDAEKIANGTYTPITGFFKKDELDGTIDKLRLPNGLLWTIPLILAPKKLQSRVKKGDKVVITYKNKDIAMVDVDEVYRIDKARLAEGVFGVNDNSHPNVKELNENYGDTAIAGRTYLISPLEHVLKKYELAPKEARKRMFELGFKSVAAFQCRNPPHRGHEYMQRAALENAEALFIHPILGKLKVGDYKPEVIYHTYDYFVNEYFPKDRVLMSPLLISMRYAGPRSAVLYAIIRRNFGCTHFTVGRDMSGVGNIYDPFAAHRLLKESEVELNMKFMFFNEIGYCKKCKQTVSDRNCNHPSEQVKISQTAIRDMLLKGISPQPEMIREDVAQKILEISSAFGSPFVAD